MSFQPFRAEPIVFEALGRGTRYTLPMGGTLDLYWGQAPTAGPVRAGHGTDLWARLQVPPDPDIGADYPHTDWFRWQGGRDAARTRALVEQSGGFLGGLDSLMACYWEAYARTLEQALRDATAYLEQPDEPEEEEDDRPRGPRGFLDGMDAPIGAVSDDLEDW